MAIMQSMVRMSNREFLSASFMSRKNGFILIFLRVQLIVPLCFLEAFLVLKAVKTLISITLE